MLECGEEKVLTLTEVERIKALAAQLVKLLRAQKNSSLPVSQLLTEYSKTFGYGLRLQDYDACSLPALLTKLCHVVKVKICLYAAAVGLQRVLEYLKYHRLEALFN